MTSNTWPDPARPGAPLNPERDGWHWVKIIHGISQPRPRLWWSKIDRWELSDGALISPSEFAERWRYLGPALTPDEAATLQKRVAELEKAVIQCWSLTKFLKPQADRIVELEEALRFYADPFKYTDIHGDDVRVPHFYSETDFGETARAALGGKDE